MRLLFLAPNPPVPGTGGGSLRMLHLIRFLGERLEVDLVAPALEGAAEARQLLEGSCRDIEFVPPSPVALAAANRRVAGNPDLRAGLVTAGLVQAARFSWAQSASDLLSVLREVAGQRDNSA